MAAALLALVGLAILVFVWRRDQAWTARERGAFFADCEGLLDDALLEPGTLGYPVLKGRRRGLTVVAEPVVDTLGTRKLPALWLKVTVVAPVATEGILDLMMRPLGCEVFSPFDRLDHRLETPEGWPAGAVLRTDNPTRVPALHLVDGHVGLFARAEAKELLVTPKGVRLVWQADEGERSAFLLLRQARFAKARLDPEVLADLVDRAIAIRDSLGAGLMRVAAE